jgi:G:T-mismatch repair DNA endonuclease (very short patch repair protein)
MGSGSATIDNHEIVVQFSAKTREELRVESLLRKQGTVAEQTDRHVAGLPDASMRKALAVVS